MTYAILILLAYLAYVFAGYPVVLMLFGLLDRRRRVPDVTPTVCVLTAARDEGHVIDEKIRNTLASDYPDDKLCVRVASDGSRDDTAERLRAVKDPRVEVLIFDHPVGKAPALNALASGAEAEVLVFTDADVMIDAQSIRRLARHFGETKVGAVCGKRWDRTERGGEMSLPARLFNLYEGAIKRGEGAIFCVLGGNGSLYAMRTSRFKPLPDDVPDDFVNILRVLEQRDKVLYEKGAVAREELSDTAAREFTRRRRTVARGIRGLWSVRSLLNPVRFPLISFLLVSHKVLRWGAGLVMALLFLCNLFVLCQPWLAALFGMQVCGYLLAMGGGRLPGIVGRLARTARFFVLSNAAATQGVMDVLRGRSWRSWPH